jgi:sulfide:quinone oxidoreductase
MVEYDLLVTVPTNMGATVVGRSGLGNEFRFVPVDMNTLQHQEHENIWAIGDAADLPCPKTASVIHNMADTVAENIFLLDAGKPLAKTFNGDTKCIIAVGGGRSVLLAFSYTQPPKTGKYPIPGIGPFSSMRPTRINNWAKYNLLWMYWNLFLPAFYKPPRYPHGD